MRLFIRYATECESFRDAWKNHEFDEQSALLRLKMCDPNAECKLELAADLVCDLTKFLFDKFSEHLHKIQGIVQLLKYSAGVWKVICINNSGIPTTIEVSKVYLATGAHPKDISNDMFATITRIDLDIALDPSSLQTQISESDQIAVVGSSHSAILVLKNLAELKSKPQRVYNFYRNPLRFAKYLSDDKIQYDNTGLKGSAAKWAQSYLSHVSQTESNNVAETLNGWLFRCKLSGTSDTQEYEKILPNCTKYVLAIGFEKNPIPCIKISDKTIEVDSKSPSGQLIDSNQCALNGLYGYGIAFPETVFDPIDNSAEYSVGLWKFMRHIRETVKHHFS